MNTLKMALAGGVALAALAMSGGTAQAVNICAGTQNNGFITTAVIPIGNLTGLVADGNTCQQQDKIFTAFAATLPASTTVVIETQIGFAPGVDQHRLRTNFSPSFSLTDSPGSLSYVISVDQALAPGGAIIQAELGQTGSASLAGSAVTVKSSIDFAPVTCTTTQALGTQCTPAVILNDASVLVTDTFTITGQASIQSVQNTFLQRVAAAPEPLSLSILGLGLAGLGFAARRRR